MDFRAGEEEGFDGPVCRVIAEALDGIAVECGNLVGAVEVAERPGERVVGLGQAWAGGMGIDEGSEVVLGLAVALG